MPVVARNGHLAYAQFNHQSDLCLKHLGSDSDQRLTARTGNNFGARVSPGGKKIVYHSDRTGNT